jgi:DNA polymerase-3 subunit alpha
MTKLVFFDTETTGLPSNDKISALNHRSNWPDLVSICWMIFENNTHIRTEDHIIRPEMYEIPPESTKIHGITQRMAEQEGKPLNTVLSKFAEDIKNAKVLCAHNLHFDKNVLYHAYKWRLNKDPTRFWPTHAEFCSMKQSQDELQLPAKYPTYAEPYKRPRLSELYYNQFGEHMQNAHTAVGDVDALQKIFFARWDIHDEKGNGM